MTDHTSVPGWGGNCCSVMQMSYHSATVTDFGENPAKMSNFQKGGDFEDTGIFYYLGVTSACSTNSQWFWLLTDLSSLCKESKLIFGKHFWVTRTSQAVLFWFSDYFHFYMNNIRLQRKGFHDEFPWILKTLNPAFMQTGRRTNTHTAL